jgi:hypothetical protein
MSAFRHIPSAWFLQTVSLDCTSNLIKILKRCSLM